MTLADDKTALRQDASSNLLALHMNHPGMIQPEAVDLEFSLLAILGDTLRAPLIKTVETMPWPSEPGLPMNKRPEELSRLDSEISELEKELSEIQKQAAEAGIQV